VDGILIKSAAGRLVQSVYGARDLLGCDQKLLSWAQSLRGDSAADALMPCWMTADSQGVLATHLRAAEVITADGQVDPLRLAEFQALVELLPHFRAAEAARVPAPKAQVVFTVPVDVWLPDEASHMRRQLVVRISDALVSADRRALLASPYWSEAGRHQLIDGFDRALSLGLPITLAGAKRDPHRTDLDSMIRFARALRDRHPTANVTVLRFCPPNPTSIFHAKLACGRIGYLGSANFTGRGLGEHVEAGLPLTEPDVDRVWWLLGVLRAANLLQEEQM
jgi:hypothetical protein